MPQLDFTTYVPQVIWLLVGTWFLFIFSFKEFYFFIQGLLKTRVDFVNLLFKYFYKINSLSVKDVNGYQLSLVFLLSSKFYEYITQLKYIHKEYYNFSTIVSLLMTYFNYFLETFFMVLMEIIVLLDENIDFMGIQEFFSILQEMIDEI